MQTVDEFAQKIKIKYPEYSEMDNRELSQKIIDKHPEYSNQVSFDFTEEQKKYPVKNPTPEFKAEIDAIEKQGQDKINKIWAGGATKILSPLVGLGLAPVTGGLSIPASMGITGLAEGAVYGAGDTIQKDLKGLQALGNTAKEGVWGLATGAGLGLGLRQLPKIANAVRRFRGNAPEIPTPLINPIKNSMVQAPEITEQPIRELATSTPQARTFDVGLQADDVAFTTNDGNFSVTNSGDIIPQNKGQS